MAWNTQVLQWVEQLHSHTNTALINKWQSLIKRKQHFSRTRPAEILTSSATVHRARTLHHSRQVVHSPARKATIRWSWGGISAIRHTCAVLLMRQRQQQSLNIKITATCIMCQTHRDNSRFLGTSSLKNFTSFTLQNMLNYISHMTRLTDKMQRRHWYDVTPFTVYTQRSLM
jgi:hypothetical protein